MKKFLNNFKRPELVWLLLILLVGGFFRFYQLGKVPLGIRADEVAIGYNAYSLYKIGKDEWGKRYPLIFKSFGDFKPPGLEYTIAFLLNFLDLNTFTVRLPSAIAGFLSIIGVFCLAREFFPHDKFLPLLGAATFAFSPWSFNLSRLFFESNVALGFLVWGLFFFFRFVNEKGETKHKIFDKNLFWAIFLFSISGYFYVAYRVISFSFLSVGLFFLWIKKKISIPKALFALFLYLLFVAPLIPQFFSAEGKIRLIQQSNTINSASALLVNEKRRGCYLGFKRNPNLTKICYLFWNKPILRIEKLAQSFTGHFSLPFLFWRNGGDYYTSSPGYGEIYFFLYPFYVLGMFILMKKVIKRLKIKETLLTLGLLLAPFPSSLVGEPSVHRATPMLPFLIIVILFGVREAIAFGEEKLKKGIILKGLIILFLISAASRYLVNYFLIYTKKNDLDWHYDITQIMEYLKKEEGNYKRVIFSDLSYNAPVLTVAFYQKMDPDFFIKNVRRQKPSKEGVTYEIEVGKYQQGNFDIEKMVEDCGSHNQGNILFITTPIEKYSRFAKEVIYDYNHSLRLAEIYDIEYLCQKLAEKGQLKKL